MPKKRKKRSKKAESVEKIPEIMLPVEKKSEITPSDDKTDSQAETQALFDEIAQILADNPLIWGKRFFEAHFRSKSPAFHLKIIQECMKNRYLAVQCPRESAKAQSVDSKVLTLTGWRRIGDLQRGDKIIGYDGKETAIVKVHPISDMDLYRVTFRGGASTLCNLDHLWRVKCPSNTKDKVLIKPLREILSNYKCARYDTRFKTHYTECRYYIDLIKPLELPEKSLPIDPYTLGVWLGDGHSAGSRVTSNDPEIMTYIPYPTKKHIKCINYWIKGLNPKLRKLNVLGNKHIPNDYLFGSIKQRTELLQGLIDTDGHVPEKKSALEFVNKNKRIIDGFVHLVQSLGGRTCLRKNVTYCNGKAFKSFKVHAWLPKQIVPCKLKRKLRNWFSDYNLKLYIENIEYEKTALGRCITVANPDGMYITDDFLPTHNSTLLAFLYPTHQIAHKKKHFIVIVQNTYGKAKETLNNIKEEIKHNQKLRQTYGIRVQRDLEGDSILQHPDGFKTRILCKGADQIGSIRGERFGAWRPDLIIVDDLEDDEMVRNPERRRYIQSLFDDALIPAGDAETCQYIIIGTILHDDSQMAKLVSPDFYKEYRKLFYIARAVNSKTHKPESLWPEKWTLETLNTLERTKPEVFAKEYQGDPVTGSLRKFDKTDFRRWYIEEDHYILLGSDNRITGKGRMSDCRAAIGCDLAWEEKKASDFSVAVPVYLTPNSDLLIDDYFCERGVRPDQLEEVLFALEARLRRITGKMVYIAMEKAKIEKVMKWFLKQAMRRRNVYLNLKDIPWVHDKIARIVLPLQPRYKMHSVYHKSGMGELEHQLLGIPAGTHDDLPDGVQIAVRALDYAPPKPKQEHAPDDPGFDWLRSQVIAKKKKPKERFVFGKRTQRAFPLPCQETWG